MRPLLAMLALMSTAARPPSTPEIDLERLVECIMQTEGGSWGKPGGRGCIHYSAWSDRTHLPYQGSMSEETALPVYRDHVEWLIRNLPKHHVTVTPAAVYACWHYGLEGGSRMIHRHGLPEDAVRCMNLYDEKSQVR